jgi:hypothetical protein
LGGENNWGEVKTLTPSDEHGFNAFGYSVALYGNLALVGAPSLTGVVYMFGRNEGGAGNWGEVKQFAASDVQFRDLYGNSVALYGDIAIIGAPSEDGGPGDPLQDAGAA